MSFLFLVKSTFNFVESNTISIKIYCKSCLCNIKTIRILFLWIFGWEINIPFVDGVSYRSVKTQTKTLKNRNCCGRNTFEWNPPKNHHTPKYWQFGGGHTLWSVLWKSVYRFNLVIRYLPSCNSKMYFIVHPHHEEVGRKKGQELKIWVISERLGQIVPLSISSSAFFQRI